MTSRTITRSVALLVALLAALSPASLTAQTFAGELNPTGDPIGGGAGYSQIYTRGDFTITPATTPAQLKATIEGASAGDVVYLEPDVDLVVPASFESSLPIKVPAGVTVASNRGFVSGGGLSQGGRIRSHAWQSVRTGGVNIRAALLWLDGPGARLTGLRLEGPANGIDILHSVLVFDNRGEGEIDNCDISKGGAANVFTHSYRTHVHHNYIHHTDQPGLGYGVLVLSSRATESQTMADAPLVEANLVTECRHALDAGDGPLGDAVFQYNIVMEPSPRQDLFKRHGGRTGHGRHTTLYRNLFWGSGKTTSDVDTEAKSSNTGPTGIFEVRENWSLYPSADGDGVVGFFPDGAYWKGRGADIRVVGNHYGGTFLRHLPEASLAVNRAVLGSGETARFTASGTDPDGHAIDAFLWTWEDGSQEWTSSPTRTRSFARNGFHDVTVRVRNEYGVMSPPANVSVEVRSGTSPYLDRLAAAWELDGTGPGLDAHGANHLLEVGSVGNVRGLLGDALNLTTAESQLVLPNETAGGLQMGRSDLTVSFWIHIRSTPSSYAQVLDFGGSSDRESGYMVALRSGDRLGAWISDESGGRRAAYAAITPGRWHRVEVAYDRDRDLEIYVDDELVNRTDISSLDGFDVRTLQDFYLGKGAFNAADATVDQVRIYKRLLTAAERTWLLNGGAGRTYEDLGGSPGEEPPVEEPPAGSTSVISLNQGWNMVALNVRPADPRFEAVFADVLSQITVVMDGQGRRFEPGGTNAVGVWDPLQAYIVHASAPLRVEVVGEPIVPEATEIPLQEGWNLVPYFGDEATSVALALSSVAGDVVVAKDEAGEVYAPDYGILQLEAFQPGRGYMVYVGARATLTYPGGTP